MKKPLYFFCVLGLLCSCNGGNMKEGVKVGPDSINALTSDSTHGDSSHKATGQHIDTAAAALPTDTAPYKRKPDSVTDSHLKKNADSSKNKMKKTHK